MSPAIASSLGVVAYLAIFAFTGVVFLFVNLLVGKLLRPHDPHPEKFEIYECGEPSNVPEDCCRREWRASGRGLRTRTCRCRAGGPLTHPSRGAATTRSRRAT